MSVRYAESRGASIAYEMLSDNGPPLVLIPPIGNRALARSIPIFDHFYDGMARYARLVVYDRRGMGMSDVGRAEGRRPETALSTGAAVSTRARRLGR